MKANTFLRYWMNKYGVISRSRMEDMGIKRESVYTFLAGLKKKNIKFHTEEKPHDTIWYLDDFKIM